MTIHLHPIRRTTSFIDWLMFALAVGVVLSFAVMMGKAFLNLIF